MKSNITLPTKVHIIQAMIFPCQLAQLPGRLCRMASKFCLSARISARSLSKLWICSSCSLDSCSKSLSFPCRAPGEPSCSLRRSSARWVSFRALAGALWVSSDPGQRSTDKTKGGLAPCPWRALPQPEISRIPTAHHLSGKQEIKRAVWWGRWGPDLGLYPTKLMCLESWALKNWCFWTVVLEKTLESPVDCKEIQPVHPKENQSWIFIGRTDVEAETPILWPPDVKSWLIWKDPDVGKGWRQEEKGTTEDETVGWHHRLNGHEFG